MKSDSDKNQNNQNTEIPGMQLDHKYSDKKKIAELCPSFNELIKAIEDC